MIVGYVKSPSQGQTALIFCQEFRAVYVQLWYYGIGGLSGRTLVYKLLRFLQKHMKAHFMRYVLYKGMSYGTLYSTALSIGTVSARGSLLSF